MPKPQPSFTAEFKQEAVQLTKTSDKPKAQIARELGISDSALYSWCRAAEAHGKEAFPGKGHQLPLEEEIHRLKWELERTQQKRDILKKSHQHLLAQPAVKYQFMAEHCGDYPVTVMCHVRCRFRLAGTMPDTNGNRVSTDEKMRPLRRRSRRLLSTIDACMEAREFMRNCRHKEFRVVKNA